MSRMTSNQVIPKPLVVGLFLLIAFAVLAVAVSRLTMVSSGSGAGSEAGGTEVGVAKGPALVSSRWLKFSDQDDGSVLILDAQSDHTIDSLAPGSNGFARGLLRGMNRERRRVGVAMIEPYELGVDRTGQLILLDSFTGNRIVMSAFGTTNAAVFDRLYLKAMGQTVPSIPVASRSNS